jgi:hypothetical protein
MIGTFYQTYHVNVGDVVRFTSGKGVEYVGVVHRVRKYINSSFGNLIVVRLDNGKGYRSFYEGERDHEVLPF